MEFWGVEVKPGKSLHVKSDPDSYIHVSQAALGDIKIAQGNERVLLKVKTGPFDMVVGTLSLGRCDQTALDLIFEKDFVLTHSCTGSVFFCGYKTDAVREDDSGSSESEEELENELKEEAKLLSKQNGKVVTKSEKEKASPLLGKPAAKFSAPKMEAPAVDVKTKGKAAAVEKAKAFREKIDEDEEDEDEDEDEEEADEEESDDEMMAFGSDEEDLESDEEESDEEDSQGEEAKPAGKPAGKKRPAPLVQPASLGKKSKTDTPGKTEVKTPVSLFTPKQLSGKKDTATKKTPGKENTIKPASGKKLGQFGCEPCNKNFTSESALSQHKLAKHKS